VSTIVVFFNACNIFLYFRVVCDKCLFITFLFFPSFFPINSLNEKDCKEVLWLMQLMAFPLILSASWGVLRFVKIVVSVKNLSHHHEKYMACQKCGVSWLLDWGEKGTQLASKILLPDLRDPRRQFSSWINKYKVAFTIWNQKCEKSYVKASA